MTTTTGTRNFQIYRMLSNSSRYSMRRASLSLVATLTRESTLKRRDLWINSLDISSMQDSWIRITRYNIKPASTRSFVCISNCLCLLVLQMIRAYSELCFSIVDGQIVKCFFTFSFDRCFDLRVPRCYPAFERVWSDVQSIAVWLLAFRFLSEVTRYLRIAEYVHWDFVTSFI